MFWVEAYGLLIKHLYFLLRSAVNCGSCNSEVIILEFMEQNQSPPLDIVLGIRIVFHSYWNWNVVDDPYYHDICNDS